MGRYRKKPVVVEATQFFEDEPPYPAGVLAADEPVTGFYVNTLEGWLWVKDGDWIVTGVQGELYPVKPGIFEETYEKVED